LGAQVDDGRLNLRLVLHPQQLDAVEVDLGDVAGLEAVAADVDDLVVVLQILPWPDRAPPWPAGSAQRRSAAEEQVALQVLVLRLGDLRAFLRALKRSSRLWSRSCR
jgi:hypothetical protein